MIRYDQKLSKHAKSKLDKKKLTIDVTDPQCIKQHFKPPPDWFVPTEIAPDPVTYHFPGYVPIFKPNTENAHQFESYLAADFNEFKSLKPHTYELVGPDVNGNAHSFPRRHLLLHGADTHVAVTKLSTPDKPLTLDTIMKWFQTNPSSVTSEGVVWHYKPPRAAATDSKACATDSDSDEPEVLMVKLTRAHCGLLDWTNQKSTKHAAADAAADAEDDPTAPSTAADSKTGDTKKKPAASTKPKSEPKSAGGKSKSKAADTKSNPTATTTTATAPATQSTADVTANSTTSVKK